MIETTISHDDQLRALGREHVNPSMLRLLEFMGYGGVAARAEGCEVWDSEGNRYLDFLGGFGVFALGHRPPEVVEAVRRQLDWMPLSVRMLVDPPTVELAALLAEVTPGDLSYTFFTNSGAEAVEGALKLCRGWFALAGAPRAKVVATEGAFHGKTFGALSASGRPKYKALFEPLVPGFVHVPFGDADALAASVDRDTAAVILEPIQGEGGVIIPPDGYLAAARSICDRHGAKLIFDEVQTGLGRCGTLFACEREGVVPDVLCLAKALGGGVMPLGAFVAVPELWSLFDDNPLLHSSTWGGNPLACAAGLAAVRAIVDQELPARAAEQGARLVAGLCERQARHPEIIKTVRGRGLLVGVEFWDEDVAGLVIAQIAVRRVLVAYTLNNPTVMRLEPPLIVSGAEIDELLGVLDEAIEMTKALLEQLGE